MRLLRTRPPDAQEILPGLLIGSAPDRRQCAALARAGVSLVVDLRAEADVVGEHWPAQVVVHHSPVQDRHAPDLDELDELADLILGAIGTGGKVLVHCEAGVGRTPTIGCAVLMRIGFDLSSAYRTVQERRPCVCPTDRQLDLLRRYDRHLLNATAPSDPQLRCAARPHPNPERIG